MALRILQVSDAYYPFPGGVSEHMHNLALHLRKRGHIVKILTGSYGEEDRGFNHNVIRVGKVFITTPKLKLFNLTQLTLTFSPKLPIIVRNLLKENYFDVVHTHGPLALNLPHLALHYSRSVNVATFHTAFVGFNYHKMGKIFFYKDSLKIDLAIGVSKVALEPLNEVYSLPSTVIPNGIDTKRFNPKVDPLPEIVNLGSRRILFLGRIEPRKGLHLLIEAFEYVLKKNKGATLIVAGDGPDRTRLLKRAREKYGDRVKFLGFIPIEDVPRVYRSVDVYTSPAVGGETFGIVLLEAMATGTPVVASQIPGYREVIKDGENGILVNVNNPVKYAEAILKVIDDENLKKQLIARGLKTAEKYSWHRIAEKVEVEYLRLMRNKKGTGRL